ncbi:MAG: 50S ribosomal protein L20 [Planctomycetota bacterium]|jgi:large subunit ribosomal protein L20|nr:50S ribosomal protein L20 [Planctomycetota bacterium]
MRTTNAPATRRRRNRVLKRAKGFRGARSKLFRMAKESTLRADAFAYVGRRQKKRDFRRLWIIRLSAAAEANGMRYSRFIDGCNKAGIALNRKELSELAIHDPATFSKICEQAKAAL